MTYFMVTKHIFLSYENKNLVRNASPEAPISGTPYKNVAKTVINRLLLNFNTKIIEDPTNVVKKI
jgi:hypothetical protein